MNLPPENRQRRNEVIRLAEYTVNTVELRGYEFSNCRILGPAVLIPMNCQIVGCTFDTPSLDAIFWEIPRTRTLIVGAVAAIDCVFSGCTFDQVGVAGPPEMRAQMEGEVRQKPI